MEHGRPRARGGTDHPNNLRPAHAQCNASKQDRGNASVRAKHGFVRGPYTRAEVARRRRRQGAIGMAAGAAVGLLAVSLLAANAVVLAVGWLVGGLVGSRLPVRASR